MPRKPTGGVVGVRLNPQQDERCRSAINTTLILKRLNAFLTKTPDPCDHSDNPKPPELTKLHLMAAGILLRKTIPDLASVTHEGADGGPLIVQILRHGESS